MFESAGCEVPEEGAAADARGATPVAGEGAGRDGASAEDQGWEANGAWAEHDWSQVPVLRWADQDPAAEGPPSVWGEDASWWDEVDPEDLVLGPVAWLEHLEPSARLMGELEGLPADLVDSDLDAVEMVAHWSRLEAHCAERKRRAAAAVARRTSMAEGLARLEGLGVRSHEANIAGDELSIRLGIGPVAARTLIRSGRAFDGIAFPTGDALAAGVIDARKADLIVTGVEDLPVDAALEVQEKVLSKAAHLPTGRLRRELAKARAAVDPEHFEQRCQAAVAARRVDEPRVLADGMASIYAVLPAVGAIQLYRAVDAAARSAKTSRG